MEWGTDMGRGKGSNYFELRIANFECNERRDESGAGLGHWGRRYVMGDVAALVAFRCTVKRDVGRV